VSLSTNCFFFVNHATANNGLQGFIPDEIRALKRLEYFNLEFNRGVVGTIPESFGDMNALTHLALQWCNLDGTIPYWLSQMSNIEYLGLGNNLLDGTVPSEIGLMQRLELLGLDDNDLYGDINIFRSLSNIKSLYLENNYFSGNLTDTLMQSWPNLEELDLSDCVFTGEVPPTMFNHQANLKVVDLHGNGFVGPLPDAINENFQLEFLVPESFANFRVLRHLDLSQNLLSYTLPEKLSEMTTLEYLFTGTNNFAPGEVPKFLIELTNLRELSMKKNQLQGSIPQFMQYLSNLRFLDFRKFKALILLMFLARSCLTLILSQTPMS
jgi:Leucine-rich repeat (LRR) protein